MFPAAARYFLAAFIALGFAIATARAQAWSNVTPPANQKVTSICRGADGFVAVGEGGTVFVTTDGATWTTGVLPAVATDVTYSPERNLYACIGLVGDLYTAVNPLGEWTARASGAFSLFRVVAGGGGFVAVGNGGIVSTSTDGITWVARPTGRVGTLSDVAYGNGVFVVVGVTTTGEGTLLVSRDGGVTFSARSIPGAPAQNWFRRVVFTGDKFYVAGYSYLLASSADGSTWSIEPHPDHSKGQPIGEFSLAALDRRLLIGAPDGAWIRDVAGNETYAGKIAAWTAAAANSTQVLVTGGDLTFGACGSSPSGRRVRWSM